MLTPGRGRSRPLEGGIMNHRAVASAVAVALCLGVGFAAPATGTSHKAKTTLTIQGPNGDFSGTVSSPKPRLCAKNRKVVVFKQLGAAQAPKTDKRIGSDTASKVGTQFQWSTGNSGFKSGRFYARAGATTNCRPGSSPTIKL
jgi:hypothetical protein